MNDKLAQHLENLLSNRTKKISGGKESFDQQIHLKEIRHFPGLIRLLWENIIKNMIMRTRMLKEEIEKGKETFVEEISKIVKTRYESFQEAFGDNFKSELYDLSKI